MREEREGLKGRGMDLGDEEGTEGERKGIKIFREVNREGVK